jgi:hypothetical protein
MLYTFETCLSVDPELDSLLAANAAHWSWGLRKAWVLLNRQGLAKPAAYAALCKLAAGRAACGNERARCVPPP